MKPAEAGDKLFLLDLLFEFEDGGNMFVRNVRLNLTYAALQTSRPYSSKSQS
jgi:hypothetical protein